MNYTIISDSISGLVAADKLIQNKNFVDLYIPNGCNFNGFLTKNLNTGSRLFELEYQESSEDNVKNISNYKPEYKGHSHFMVPIKKYLDELFSNNLVKVDNPKLIIKNNEYKDFLYGDYFKEAAKFLKNKKEKLNLTSNFKIDNYTDYLSKLNEFNNFIDLSKTIHDDEIHNIIKSLYQKLNVDFELISKYHRILWLPVLWDSSIWKYFENQSMNLKDSKFYKVKNSNFNFVENLISKLNKQDGLNVIYFDPSNFRVVNSKVYIGNNVFKDSNKLIVSLSLKYFENNFNDIDSDDSQLWNFANFKFDKSYLLKEFSQITFTDKELPYRVSYLDLNQEINLCIEYGVNLTEESKVFEFLVNSKFMSEKILQSINEINEFKIPFKIPTYKNEQNYNLKLEKINDLLKNSIKLAPISFYQSSALNEQIAQGLAIESKLS